MLTNAEIVALCIIVRIQHSMFICRISQSTTICAYVESINVSINQFCDVVKKFLL